MRLPFASLLLSLFVAAIANADDGLLLAEKGKAQMPIVVSQAAMNATEDYKWGYFNPTTGERQVAYELAELLGRITGAEFDVLALGAKWTLVADDDNSEFGVKAPRGLAVDRAGNVYVTEDGNPGVFTVFDDTGAGKAVVELQSTGSTHWPNGIDVAASGDIAIAVGTANGRGEIQLYNGRYQFVRRLNLDSHGGCKDVAFDADGNLWVTSERDFKVYKFRTDGKLLLTIPNRPGLKRDYWYFPSGIDVDAKGRVIVSDFYNVVRFDPADYTKTMELFAGSPGTSDGTGDGEFAKGIGGVDIDSKGRVYIADRGNARIQVFDSQGKFIKVIDNDLLENVDDTAVDADGNVYGSRVGKSHSAVYKFLANPVLQLPEKAIVVGTIGDFPQPNDPGVAPQLTVGDYFDGVEAYVIRTQPNRLLLLGATPLGASHAVSEFLERLGYRLFFPGDNWEVVPSHPTLRVKMNVAERPDFLAYQALYGYGGFDNDGGKCLAKYDRWMRRNRKGMSLPIRTGHSWQQIILDNKTEFDTHPEYFALVKGKRDVRDPVSGIPKLCVSNPNVVRLCKRWAKDYFAKHPNEQMVSMEPSDYNGPVGHCECEKCAAIGRGTSSDKVFFLANEVAKEVAPLGKMVGLLAYEHHSDLPSFPLEKNIYVQLARIFIRGEHPYDELVERWPQKAKAVGFYDYWSVFHWTKNMLPSRYGNNVSYLADSIRKWHQSGGTSLNPEISNSWGINGRGWYLAVNLRWDTQLNVDTLLDDFYAKAFGPAAGTMKTYYERLDWSKMPIFTDHVAALAFRDLEKATTEAAGRPDVLARLDDLKLYMHYFHLKWLFDREKDMAAREKLALRILTHSYKSRHAYMFDWAWIGKWWIGKITNWDPRGKVGDPAKWAYGNPNAPWRDESLYTHDEIESFFQENLKYWQPQKNLIERKFSADLVPVRFAEESSNPNAIQTANYQGDGVFTTVYAMYSTAGEDLKIRIRPGTVYQDKPPLFYRVEDAKGKVIAKGKLPPNKLEHDVTIKVPGSGQYLLDVQDNGGGWLIKAHRDTPLSVKVQGESIFHNNQGDQTWHFYVPKGTREIHYFPGNHGGSHRLIGPKNEVIATVPHDGKIKTIKVPAGMDGARWSLYGAVRSFWFYNLPNWIGASPNALMVPRDVAVRDGLDIRGQ